ncbi:hypothetical protein Smp_171430 [Schistosoma mansoni]|nr:hypothetical protein Smp_171430 [Schistosoma mansoni]|eukprot:XP_018650109.1 hypothetical protein Smp_171430 [Schistosoma mansoni]
MNKTIEKYNITYFCLIFYIIMLFQKIFGL